MIETWALCTLLAASVQSLRTAGQRHLVNEVWIEMDAQIGNYVRGKFNEILIIDGGSKDGTLKIAKKFKCKIKRQPKKFKFKNNKIKDFSKLRDYILKLSKNDLVLFLDSDEFLKKSALKRIDFYSKSQISKKKYYSFLLGRFPIHKNKTITQKTIFYPNYQDRLFYKSNIKTFIKPVHERVIPKNKYLIKKKIENASILFPLDINYKKIYKKYEYYFEIEKNIISRKNFFNSLKFTFKSETIVHRPNDSNTLTIKDKVITNFCSLVSHIINI